MSDEVTVLRAELEAMRADAERANGELRAELQTLRHDASRVAWSCRSIVRAALTGGMITEAEHASLGAQLDQIDATLA